MKTPRLVRGVFFVLENARELLFVGASLLAMAIFRDAIASKLCSYRCSFQTR